jgi:hypothetical protein
MKTACRAGALLLALLLCFALAACGGTEPVNAGTETDPPVTQPPETDPPETDPPETEPPETDPPETEPPETEPPETEPPETEPPETDPPETDPPTINENPPFVNPLTGLKTTQDLSQQRPAAIMINNIRVSCPQIGISKADVIYECLVEGGYTRLMMLALDYAALPEIGSVRSSRDYYLDFAADYDAIYVHAGGSEYAYDAIQARGVNNLDGVNMWVVAEMFYRNQERIATMGLEHSLMTTGEKIVWGVARKNYRTALTEDFNYPLDFAAEGTTLSYQQAASHIRIPYSIAQTTDFVYDRNTGKYLRYQFGGEKHIDGATGEQLSFENVMILFCQTGAITGDPKNRIDVGTIGEGKGYYATCGTYITITWEKTSHESPIRFYDQNGDPLRINRGKTFVSVCPTTVEQSINFNFVWKSTQ